MINTILVARTSVVQIGLTQILRASRNIHLSACVDSFDLLPTVIAGLPWAVLVILPDDGDDIPQVVMQAANVVYISVTGIFDGTSVVALAPHIIENAVQRAAIHDPARAYVDNAQLLSTAQSAKFGLRSHSRARKIELSRHQQNVLALVVKGLTNGEIAQVLGVSLPTARYHVSAILAKLGASNRTEASAVAIDMNLIERN